MQRQCMRALLVGDSNAQSASSGVPPRKLSVDTHASKPRYTNWTWHSTILAYAGC